MGWSSCWKMGICLGFCCKSDGNEDDQVAYRSGNSFFEDCCSVCCLVQPSRSQYQVLSDENASAADKEVGNGAAREPASSCDGPHERNSTNSAEKKTGLTSKEKGSKDKPNDLEKAEDPKNLSSGKSSAAMDSTNEEPMSTEELKAKPDDLEKTGDQTGDPEDFGSGKSSAAMDSTNEDPMSTEELIGHETPQKSGKISRGLEQFSSNTSKQKKPRFSKAVKVHVLVSNPTLRSHETFIKKLEMSLNECSLVESTVVLLFCPVVTRMGTDVEAAVRDIPDDKKVILVVMHHSYTPDHVDDIAIAPPRSNVVELVQCVFHETFGLLECELNQRAVKAVRSALKSLQRDTVQDGRIKGTLAPPYNETHP